MVPDRVVAYASFTYGIRTKVAALGCSALLALAACGVDQSSSPSVTSQRMAGTEANMVTTQAATTNSVRNPETSVYKPDTRTATTIPARPGSSRQALRPSRLRLESIGIDEKINRGRLQVDANRKLLPPVSAIEVGWYQASGPLLLVGHVDSAKGPGAFFGVARLKRGDPVEVSYEDETSRRFTVKEVLRLPKDEFPTDLVYRATDTDLRIVTCGGEFNRQTGHYVDNVIVFASPSSS